MTYKLDERIVIENLLNRHFPEQRNIVTIGNCSVLYNHPPVKGKRDLGPNCVVIQKGRNFLAPSFKPVIKENYYDPGIIVWFIELMNSRSGWETNPVHKEELYLFIESVVPYERIPIWDWNLGKTNIVYMNYMNDVVNKFKWMNSVFHESLRINNSMTKYAENAKQNIDLFSFVISGIAESSDLAELYNKTSGSISISGYFKREITRDILFKIVQGIYFDSYVSGNQYDFHGDKISGLETWDYKPYYQSEIIKQNPVIKGERLENYKKRIMNEYAEKLYAWYSTPSFEDSEMSPFRIQKGIDFSKNLRTKNKNRPEVFRMNL